jgi:pimeloyl-ACP methyl ester carboxylesterase
MGSTPNTKCILSKTNIFFILFIIACQGTAEQQMKVKDEYAPVNGLKMYYEIHGKGEPLVLLHGSFMWGTNYPTLSEGRQLIAIDMQGHGRTADINRPFTFEQMADDTAALLKHLKIEQADIFGYSMGGTIGLALAIRHPDLVRRLAIYGSVYRPIEESYPPDMLKDFRAITPDTFAPKELKEPYEKMSPAPNWRRLVAKIIQMEKDFKGFSQEQMKAIKAEVFIGAGDRYDVDLKHIVEMHNLIPKSQLAVFPNSDHLLFFANPDKLPPQIKEFLNTEK